MMSSRFDLGSTSIWPQKSWTSPFYGSMNGPNLKTLLERAKGMIVSPSMCVYLQKCHHNFVSITWKHLKCIFSFYNSSLKNQKIEWWKKNLKTNPNKLLSMGSTIFKWWVIKIEWWVIKTLKTKQPLNVPKGWEF